MSDRLAISASFSVLMMAVYVLFGANAEWVPIGPAQFSSDYSASAGLPSPSASLQLLD